MGFLRHALRPHACFYAEGSSFVGTQQNVLAHLIYFSFVSLGTLGYGDIIPVGGSARALAVTKTIAGQMNRLAHIAGAGLWKRRGV